MIGLATPATIGSIVRMVTGGAGRKVVVHGGGRIRYTGKRIRQIEL